MTINYLGVDWGEKRIGLALADSENKIATPFRTIENITELVKVVLEEEINSVVIGLPKKMSTGEIENPNFSKFIKILQERLLDKNISFDFIDERLSSVQADTLKVKEVKYERDSVSAMIILQSYLDKKYD
ncbi:MAG TPA: Holliday junction resolvase RuvX [bacterium]|nr:Holliday junction resolvase RuvX [bacterium]